MPTSLKAPAKPKPCSKPNENAITHGNRCIRFAVSADASAGVLPRELGGEEQNAERDDRLDGRRLARVEAERRGAERDAVSDRERRDGCDEAANALHDQEQRQNEQQVIEAEQDVLDAEHEVRAHDLERARPLGDRRRLAWRQALVRRGAVQVIDAQQHVGLRLREAVDRERFAAEAVRARQRAVLQPDVVDDVRTPSVSEQPSGTRGSSTAARPPRSRPSIARRTRSAPSR